MTASCAYCGRPLAPMDGHAVGPVKFCDKSHLVEWFSIPKHDRRRVEGRRHLGMERRSS